MEVDGRLLGMLLALAVMWLLFNVLSGGLFLSARNLWNLSVQSAAVAIMATGMVLIIVSRNIDLSIGSIVVLRGDGHGAAPGGVDPESTSGSGSTSRTPGSSCSSSGSRSAPSSAASRGSSSRTSGSRRSSSRSAACSSGAALAFVLASGRTIAPLDTTFQLLGGGPQGSLGETASWVVGILAVIGVVYGLAREPAAAAALRLPAAPGVGGRHDRHPRLRGSPRRGLGREQLHVAAGPGRGVRARAAGSRSRRAGCRSRPGSRTRCSSPSGSRSS